MPLFVSPVAKRASGSANSLRPYLGTRQSPRQTDARLEPPRVHSRNHPGSVTETDAIPSASGHTASASRPAVALTGWRRFGEQPTGQHPLAWKKLTNDFQWSGTMQCDSSLPLNLTAGTGNDSSTSTFAQAATSRGPNGSRSKRLPRLQCAQPSQQPHQKRRAYSEQARTLHRRCRHRARSSPQRPMSRVEPGLRNSRVRN